MDTLIRFGTLALCAVVGASASFATPRAAAADVTVSFVGLNFSWPEDARALYLRLRRAADGICVRVSLLGLAEYATCRRCLLAALDPRPEELQILDGYCAPTPWMEAPVRHEVPRSGRA
jgi:UrcA family protein